MKAGGRGPRETVGLVLAVGGCPPAGIAEICRTIDAGGFPPGSWRTFRRPSIFWDGPGRELDAAAASLETSGSGARRRTLFTSQDEVIRRRTMLLPPALPVPAAPGPWEGLELQPVLTRSAGGRIRPAGGSPSSTIAVEAVVWRQADRERRERLVVLSAEPENAGRMLSDARLLSAMLPLRLVGERPDRLAYRHLSGDRPRSIKVAPGALETASSAGDAFVLVGRSALRQMLGNLELAMDPALPEAIHQFRVGLRRLRAALTLFGDCLDATGRRALLADLKWINAIFADVREWDVFTSEMLAPMTEAVADRGDLALASGRAVEHRAAAHAALVQALHGERLTGTLLDLLRWFELAEAPLTGKRAGQPLRKFARRALRRGQRKLMERYETARPASVEEWHALRIQAKKLRYATDAFAPLYPRAAVRPFQHALQEVQDCLGLYNDAAVAERLARIADPETAAAMVAGWAARERMEQQRRFDGAWKKLRKKAPFWRRD